MSALTFQGDAFSEYYLTSVVWEDARLRNLLGTDSVNASYRRAASELLRAERALRDRHMPKSTRTLLLDPLAESLGWTLGEEETVQTAEGTEDAGSALLVEGRPVARVLAIAPNAPLDLPPTGHHRRFAPTISIVRVLEELNQTWGILINRYYLRLVRRAEGFVASHLEFDLASIAAGSPAGFEAWRLLWALLRQDAFITDPPLLDRVVAAGRWEQEKVSSALGTQVQGAIIDFLQGIVSHPDNRDKLPSPLSEGILQQLYAESLRVLYRMLFALYGESRGLLPDVPTYRDGYSITRLARRAVAPETDPRRVPTSSGRYFEFALKALFELLRCGADLGPEGKIPMYGGALFDHARTKQVEELTWGDETVAKVLERLTTVETETGRVRLSYRELDVEQLGAIYENLLEQKPYRASETMYKIELDGRQLWVNSTERSRLAERRGEVTVAALGQEEDETEEQEDEEAAESAEESEGEAQEEEAETPPRSRKPIKVLDELPAGMVYLKAGMGRKQTGSYYTSRPLVEFLVREALDPLAEGKTPEEILSLSVVDPAMGSGHFLVGACRRLSYHLLNAYRKRYQEVSQANPDMLPEDVFNEAGIHPAVKEYWDYEDRAQTACRLLIAGNCIYGVDKNPLAVDLARVSLWLTTAAIDHPLTFLDHRLRIGDSLVGLPLYLGDGEEPEAHLLKPEYPSQQRSGRGSRRRRQEAPLFAGVTSEELVSQGTLRLRERITRALRHLHRISDLMNDSPGDFAGQRAAFEAMQGELRPFWNLHQLRIGRVFLPPSTIEEADLVNRWLRDIARNGQPSEEDVALASPAQKRGEEIGAFCWMLAYPELFFNADGSARQRQGFDAVIGNPPWDKIKPNERECFSDFDPTVWDVQGQERKRLIARIREEIPGADEAWQKHESETKALAKYLLEGGSYHHQIAEIRDDEGNTRKAGSDPDTFKFFAERAYQLLRLDGRAGIILPQAIQYALGSTALRRLLLDCCRIGVLCKLDNERRIFAGVHHNQRFDLVTFQKGGQTGAFLAAFLSWEPAEVILRLRDHPRRVMVDASLYKELSPEHYTFVELRDQRELGMLQRICEQFPRLGQRLEGTWNVSFTREFDMTNDSFCFRDAARLKQMGATLHSPHRSTTLASEGAPFETDERGEYWTTPDRGWYLARPDEFVAATRWVDSRGRVYLPDEIDEEKRAVTLDGFVLASESEERGALPVAPSETYLPLYEGRMVHQFDHCQKAYVTGSGARARWVPLEWNEKRLIPHFFVSKAYFLSVYPNRLRYRFGYGRITGQANERTLLAAALCNESAVGEAIPCFTTDDPRAGLFWLACANSFFLDYLIRLQVANNISFFIMLGLPVPRLNPAADELQQIAFGAARLSLIDASFRELHSELSNYWPGQIGNNWERAGACLDTRERGFIRAELDARIAKLYGLSATEYARVLSSFPLLDQDQPPLPGDVFIRQTNKGEKIEPRGFITRDLALLKFFELLGQEPPTDIVAFFADAGVDIERQTGRVRDLRKRVEEAQRRGAVAYIPSTGKGWSAAESPYLPEALPQPLAQDWEANISNWIVEDPQINGGEPTLRSTRIAASLIYDLLNSGWTFDQVLESYPHLSPEQVAVAYRWGQLR